jgi:hypothetical protein
VTGVGVHLDDYVPLDLVFEGMCVGPPICWSAGERPLQVIEVGLSPESGAVCTVTLTFYDEHLPEGPDATIRVPVVLGVPVCDISAWASGPDDPADCYLVEQRRFEVLLGPTRATVRVASVAPPARLYRAGPVDFVVDAAGALCAVCVNGLSPEAVKQIGALAAMSTPVG